MSTVDESLAKALGWTNCPPLCPDLFNPSHHCMPHNLPKWTEDMNACLRDIVPVLDARGIGTTITLLPGGFAIVQMFDRNADRNHEEPDYIVDIGPKPLLAAFCEAAVQALEATNG